MNYRFVIDICFYIIIIIFNILSSIQFKKIETLIDKGIKENKIKNDAFDLNLNQDIT